MKNKIKLFSLIFITLMIFSLTGCGKEEPIAPPPVDARTKFLENLINIISFEKGSYEITIEEKYKNNHIPGNILATDIITVNEIESKIDKIYGEVESTIPLKMTMNKSYSSTETGIEEINYFNLIANNRSYYIKKDYISKSFDYEYNTSKLTNPKKNKEGMTTKEYEEIEKNARDFARLIENAFTEQYILINFDELGVDGTNTLNEFNIDIDSIGNENIGIESKLKNAILFELFKQTELLYPTTLAQYDYNGNYVYLKFNKELIDDFANKLKGLYDTKIDSIINYYCNIYQLQITESYKNSIKTSIQETINLLDSKKILTFKDDYSIVIALFTTQTGYQIIVEQSDSSEHKVTTTITLNHGTPIIETPQSFKSFVKIREDVNKVLNPEEEKEEIKEETNIDKEYEFFDDENTPSFATPLAILNTNVQSKEIQIGKNIYTWPINLEDLKTSLVNTKCPEDFATYSLSIDGSLDNLLGYETIIKKEYPNGIETNTEVLTSISVASRFLKDANASTNIILPQGIQLNKTKDELVRVYGSPTSIEEVTSTQFTYTYEYLHMNYKIEFKIYNNLIDEIKISNINNQ